jgi:LPXTG-site transpeptidase (sortase) family protein
MAHTQTIPVNQAELIQFYRRALLAGVPLDQLDRKVKRLLERSHTSQSQEHQDDQKRDKRLIAAIPRAIRFGATMVPIVLIALGVSLVGSAVMPIFGYYLYTVPQMRATDLLAPIPRENVLDVMPLVIAEAKTNDEEDAVDEGKDTDMGPIVVDTKLDYTNLSNWFGDGGLPQLSKRTQDDEKIIEYRIDIPKVDIANAMVTVGGDNLNNGLIQYQGTSLPGKAGSPVIFGHSVLRQFYNPKESNPRRYTSIFSKIMTLQKGDKIYVTVGNAKYTYVVQEKSQVKPTDTFILSQRYDAKQLKLVTCVPEGTYLYRGVVTAQLIAD